MLFYISFYIYNLSIIMMNSVASYVTHIVLRFFQSFLKSNCEFVKTYLIFKIR